MTGDGVQIYRQTENGKQNDVETTFQRSDYLREKGKYYSPQTIIAQTKPTKRIQSAKKPQTTKKPTKDFKIEDSFANSEYFKHHSSSLNYSNGDGMKTFNSFETLNHPPNKEFPNSGDSIYNDVGFISAKDRDPAQWVPKINKTNSPRKIVPNKKDNLLDGILFGKGKSDCDLITLITDQMFSAEKELQITRTHLMDTMSKLNERDLEILKLHEKIQSLQKMQKTNSAKKEMSETPNKTSDDYQRLVVASEKLKKQVKDMEDFLNDYGLVWVGDRDSKPDFDKIIKSFEKLNVVASQPKIIQTTLGAKFTLPRGIPVVFYSNGILLREKEFRDYSDPLTTLFLQDIEDGYYPSELQTEYPEGVPFEVTDKRNEVYQKNKKPTTFQGRGVRLGSTFEKKPGSVVFLEPVKEPKPRSIPSVCSHYYFDKFKKFHKKRPRTVHFQDDAASSISSRTNSSLDKGIATNYSKCDFDGSDNLWKLKIRYGKNKAEPFVLKVSENEKLLGFRDSLQKKLCEMYHDDYLVEPNAQVPRADFELHIYGKPPVRLSDNLNKSLKECGVIDNSSSSALDSFDSRDFINNHFQPS